MVSYQNFRGETYYLYSKKTKKGNTTFYFSKQSTDAAPIAEVPKEFEIYEEPNGKVYLRKKSKPYIHEQELKVIQTGIEKHSGIDDFKLDIKKKTIYVYIAHQPLVAGAMPNHLLEKHKQYDTSLRFILTDEEERRFEVERFCYSGSVDDWIFLAEATNLEELVQKYVQHLGKESFYDLF
ncbi:hypothetical protein [Alkalihalobacillus sp. 1P02AB]|uniref:hypothetical protein n=1 Tax=Alkalihalobacillus sp. 1P02AB TaxID=3132260 RepID=UPI0039A5522C